MSTATQTDRAELQRLASRLAGELRDLADWCELAAQGDERAKKLLRMNIDSYHFGIVVGPREVQALTVTEDAA